MTDFELGMEYMHRALIKIAEVQQYNWDDEYCLSEIKSQALKLNDLEGYREIDPHSLTKDEMLTLGFKFFDDNLLCIPLWLMTHIKDGVKLLDINGKEVTFRKGYQDSDHRFGVISVGVFVD